MLGKVELDEMIINDAGQIVWDIWYSLPDRYTGVTLGPAVVMPNHFHGVVIIEGRNETPAPSNPVSASTTISNQMVRRKMLVPLVVGYFKMNTSKRINLHMGTAGSRIWHRNYYEHIIRNDVDGARIERYILSNPSNWA
jgi:putative transposase